jgi:FSR family fosmidomycin resistance protein-like MFS transporter
MGAGIDKRAMAALSGGHLATDLAQGALPALLPFLVVKFDLSYTMAAALILAVTLSSSVVQPAFGLWSDARGALWLLPAGAALAGIGMALAAVAPTYPLVVLAVLVSGLGVAAYHPEGSKFASYASGERRASGMSLFSIGGNVGFALGPVVASSAILALGLEGGLLLALPGLLIGAVLLAGRGYLARFAARVGERTAAVAASARPRSFAILLAVIGFRSVAHMGLFTFVPLWEVAKGNGEAYGTRLLALFLFAGALGTVFGGPLADRFGRRAVLLWSFVAATPLVIAYVLVGGVAGEVALVLSGAAIICSFSVTLVMSQEYLPQRIGVASGLSIGLAIGLGGFAALSLGALADAVDLRTALLATAAGPAVAILLTLLLPSSPRARVVEPATSPI